MGKRRDLSREERVLYFGVGMVKKRGAQESARVEHGVLASDVTASLARVPLASHFVAGARPGRYSRVLRPWISRASLHFSRSTFQIRAMNSTTKARNKSTHISHERKKNNNQRMWPSHKKCRYTCENLWIRDRSRSTERVLKLCQILCRRIFFFLFYLSQILIQI